MGKFRVSPKWTEQDCRDVITKLLEESASRYEKNNYDNAAAMLIAAAKTMMQIPTIKRKELHRKNVNDLIKERRKKQKEKDEEQYNQKNDLNERRNSR